MAGNIKGITIEIGGDTSPLNKALDGVNKKSKDLQSELRQVDRLLKLDPNNTTLLAQKQELLGKSIGNTKDKLDTLKEAEKQVQVQFKKGEVSEEQFRALQREIVQTETNLASMKTEAIKANAVLSKDEAVGNLKNIAKFAGGAALAVGGALVGAAVKAGQSADDINTLAKQTGLATGTIQKFQYASERIDVSMDTLTGSMSKLTKNMGNAAGGSKSAQEAFATLGVSITDNNGNLRDNEDVFNDAITALGGMTNETERDAAAMGLFGKSAQDLNPLILGGADALKTMGKEAEDAGLILSQDALDSANEFADSMDELKAVSVGVFSKLGTEVAEKLTPMLLALGDILKGLPEWFEKNSTMLTIIGIVIGTITTLIIAFNIQQALMATGMTLWTAVGAGATAVTTALGVAMAFLTSPIGLVIIAIGAIIAIGVLLFKNWDKIKEKAGQLGNWLGEKWDGIKEATSKAWNSVKDAIGGAINGAKEKVSEGVENIKNGISERWSKIGEKTSETWGKVKDTIGNVMGAAKDVISEKLGNMKKAFDDNGGGIKGTVTTMMEGIKGRYSEGFDFINNLTGGKLDEIKSKFSSIFSGIKDVVSNAIDKIKGIFDFDWKLPKIKLPHFDISGKFSLSPPQIPKLSVDWYKTGAIFNSPSVIGVGEAGAEAVLPIEKIDSIIASALKKAGNSVGGAITIQVNSILDGNIVAKSVNKVNLRDERRYNP